MLNQRKIGRNEKCYCGSEKKYKKCCLQKDERHAELRKKIKSFSRKDFISGPYKKCPKCDKETFGVSIHTGGNRYCRECTTCWYSQSFTLPAIKKKVIYLDQFFISNITKALDPEAGSHKKVLEQPFWLDAYEKLDTLGKLNLAIYPDSSFHSDESLLCGDPSYESIKEVYEHLSSGCTFYDYNTITRFQVQQHIKNYLSGSPERQLVLNAENVIHGHLHEWLGRMRVGVNMRPYDGKLEELKRERDEQYESIKKVFERWQTERDKNFIDWVREESNAFGEMTIKIHLAFLKKKAELPQKYAEQYLQGIEPEIKLEDVFPPPSSEIIEDVIRELSIFGLKDEEATNKMIEYFHSKHIGDIPTVHISSLLFAGIARRAGLGGQKAPPNRGTVTDVNAIASLLPYCDAIFIDNQMASLLNEQPLKKEMKKYNTKIFSLNTKDDFMKYLDEIKSNATHEHLSIIDDVYGKDWAEPYMTLLIQKKHREEDEVLLDE